MNVIDTSAIAIPLWPTPPHKIRKAFSDGKMHALNHFNNEVADPDWPFGVKSWAVNPYTDKRPDAYYSWIAGFCAEWGELNRVDD